MKITVVKTGNEGNCYVITTTNPRFPDLPKSIMIDCGGGKLEGNYGDVGCVCITHSHTDHIGALGWFLHDRNYEPIVVIGEGEYNAPISQNALGLRYGLKPNVFLIKDEENICVGNFVVRACLAHHDTDYPLHYFISDGTQCVFVGCDTNDLSNDSLELISQSDAIIIESNYSETILDDLNDSHRERLTGYGHLSNNQIRVIKQYFKRAKKILLVHANENLNTKASIKSEVDWDSRYILCMPNECPIETFI